MKDFIVSVRKLTDLELLQEACATKFLGNSHATLISMYKSEHSPVRTQLFWVSLKNIPLYISTHLLRHHVGSIPFQLTCRSDRHGGNPCVPEKLDLIKSRVNGLVSNWSKGGVFIGDYQRIADTISEELDWLKENSDRETPVNLSLCINAQSLIDMAKLRLCSQASAGTREVFKAIRSKISEIDLDLAKMMVPKCVYRGGICGEPKCCGYNATKAFKEELYLYLSNFNPKQKGCVYENRD